MSYKAEVVADHSGKWCCNALRFSTYVEAQAYAADLARRWMAVSKTCVTESNEPINAVFEIRDRKVKYLS